MKRYLIAAACLLLCLHSGAQVPAGLPSVLDISSGVTSHVQGIAVNSEKGEIYYSFTTRFIAGDSATQSRADQPPRASACSASTCRRSRDASAARPIFCRKSSKSSGFCK